MMLTLRVIRYQDQPPPREISLRVDEGGCTIGRKTENDLVLPDPKRAISSQHARIDAEAGGFYVTDTSTNGTYLNGTHNAVGKDNRMRLSDGDEILIGEYVIQVNLAPDATVMKESRPTAADETSIGGGMSEGHLSLDPLELLGGGAAGGQSPAGAKPPTSPPRSLIPDDFDLLGDERPATPFSGSQRDDAPVEQQAFQPPNAIPEDWDPLGEEHKPVPSPSASPPPPPPPTPPPPPKVEPPAATAPRPAAPAGPADQAAMQAFLAGAGLSGSSLPTENIPEFMRLVGELLRHMTHGVMTNLAGRTNVKNEMRLEMTTIRAAENNPLKFSIDVEDALRHLLFEKSKGYLGPLVAVDEAFDDMQAHHMAVLVAMRATLDALLTRFDPHELETKFNRDTFLNKLIQSTPARKVKYWDLFTERYGQIAKDAEEGFMQLFAVEFTRAYENQVRTYKKARRDKN